MKNQIFYICIAVIALVLGVTLQQWSRPDFATIQDGKSYSMRDLRGNWLVINYFAEWCAPCLKEVPELNAFYRESGYPLFAISYDQETDNGMRELASKYQMQFPIISVENSLQLPFPRPKTLPTTYIYNPEGDLIKTIQGQITHSELVATIRKLERL